MFHFEHDNVDTDRQGRNGLLRVMFAFALIFVICIVSVSCKKNSDDTATREIPMDQEVSSTPTPAPTATPSPTATPIPTPTPEPTPTPNLHIGEVRSELTGLWVKEEVAKARPWSFTLNNIVMANPQSGIGEASIVYEALAEGGITRFLGIFEGLDENSACAERIGSVRSARHYFVSFAREWDALFIHFGGAYYAYDKLEELGYDDMDCMSGAGVSCYYRDKEISAPHNAFCTVARVNKCLANGKYRLEHKSDFKQNHFVFNDEALYPLTNDPVFDDKGDAAVYPATKVNASKITLYYRKSFQPYMTYNPETHMYNRYQFGDIHIDYNTQEPLEFTNIIIQIVKEWDKDHNGYQDMDIVDATGKGYYISMGQCVPITWKKVESTNFMSYYDEKGNVLSINPGKTFISIYPDFREDKLVIE